MNKVFVYGTLLKGFSNHTLLKDARFIGTARLNGYGLYCVTPCYPGIVQKNGAAVNGEVYEVDSSILKRLDNLEDEGTLYCREVNQCTLEDGTIEKVYVYRWIGTVKENDYIPVNLTPWHPGKSKI